MYFLFEFNPDNIGLYIIVFIAACIFVKLVKRSSDSTSNRMRNDAEQIEQEPWRKNIGYDHSPNYKNIPHYGTIKTGTEEENTGTTDIQPDYTIYQNKYKNPSKELKGLYRDIVKELHPDVNQDITKAESEMLINTISAYKNKDLVTLRKIAVKLDIKP